MIANILLTCRIVGAMIWPAKRDILPIVGRDLVAGDRLLHANGCSTGGDNLRKSIFHGMPELSIAGYHSTYPVATVKNSGSLPDAITSEIPSISIGESRFN